MSWVAASCIKSFEREDGKARLFMLAREDGLYMFDGQEAIEENGETVWVPSSLRSGLFETAEMAKAEAMQAVPWLSESRPPTRSPG